MHVLCEGSISQKGPGSYMIYMVHPYASKGVLPSWLCGLEPRHVISLCLLEPSVEEQRCQDPQVSMLNLGFTAPPQTRTTSPTNLGRAPFSRTTRLPAAYCYNPHKQVPLLRAPHGLYWSVSGVSYSAAGAAGYRGPHFLGPLRGPA